MKDFVHLLLKKHAVEYKRGKSRVCVMLLGQHTIAFLSVCLSSTHIITSRSSLQSICVIKVMSLEQLGEARDRMDSLWYAVKQIHVITEV